MLNGQKLKNEKNQQLKVSFNPFQFYSQTKFRLTLLGEKENKKYEKKFSTIETFCLLKIYVDNSYLFKNHQKKQYVVWDEISDQMIINKYERSRDSCINRFTNLKKKYVELKRSLRSGDGKPDWEFYDDFEKIMGEKPVVKPHTQLDSLSAKSVNLLLKRKAPEAMEM